MLYLKLWDVKHGNAVYLKTPNSKHIVLDLGIGSFKDGSETFSPLSFIQEKMKVEQLDEVIITHPHADHIKDISNLESLHPKVLNRPKLLTDEEIIAANRTEDRELVDEYIEFCGRYSESLGDSDSPLQTENNGGANIQVFQSTGCAHTDINNQSIITVISYAQSKVVLTGDNGEESWRELLGQSGFKQAIRGTDIFVASYHGTERGYCKELFDCARPKLFVVSNGRFPDSGYMERFSEAVAGLDIHTRSGGMVKRKCLTTKNDGSIEIAMGWSVKGKKSFLSVTAD